MPTGYIPEGPHGRRRNPDPDLLDQLISDGAFEHLPEAERPGWYVRGRKPKLGPPKRVELVNGDVWIAPDGWHWAKEE